MAAQGNQARGRGSHRGHQVRLMHALNVFLVRAARREDGPALQEIERLAGELFRNVGLAVVADDEPPALDELASYAKRGRSWVAVGNSGEPLGYVIVDDVDGNAHVEQVSVRPEHQGLGVGRALLDRVCRWASQTGRLGITLTIYAEVPWNRPLYEHLGFRVLREDEVGPELHARREAEKSRGLDVAPRVCMRLDSRP